MASRKRVCIIGAGPSGCSALIQFHNLCKNGTKLPDIVCYEKQDNWGGLWNFTWRTGVDQYGEPVHGGMYRHLWANGPKEVNEYGDYTYDDHFKQRISSFPPRTAVLDYLQGRWRKYRIRDKIRFNHAVQRVDFDATTRQFSVQVNDLKSNDDVITELFDYVIVCGGHYSCPNVPEFPGIMGFPGRILHAHDFRDASQFKGERILVIGGSYSAEDITLQTMKFGARHVTISARSGPIIGYHWPHGVDEKPRLKRIDKDTVTFTDGTSADYDTIILCTGYVIDNRFMSENLRLNGANPLYPDDPVYLGIAWMREAVGQLFYIGYEDQFYTFNMFDLQTYTAAKIILGLMSLPSYSEMMEDYQKWKSRSDSLTDYVEKAYCQTDYLIHLKQLSGYPYRVDAAEYFRQRMEHRQESVTTYRERAFTSIHTGTKSVVYRTPWMQAMTDDLEDYIMNCTD